MALYKHKQYLSDSEHRVFDLLQRPGKITLASGIYRCEVCACEVVSEKTKPLPPNDHHIHAEELGPIQWRLIVRVQPNGGLGITTESKSAPSRLPSRAVELELDDENSN